MPFIPMAADLDMMLERADAAILIGDPALLALEERSNRVERTDEELVYRDLAEEWRALTGLAFVSAVWSIASSGPLDDGIAETLLSLATMVLKYRGARRRMGRPFPVPESTIRSYLATNIHYVLDEECVEGMRGFFRMAAECGVLPPYSVAIDAAV